MISLILLTTSTDNIFTAAPKAKKSVDLFGSGDDDEDDDDDSLFGVKAPKKAEPKAEPPKKKVYSILWF